MGCEYSELVQCLECGQHDRADRIIYGGHECDPDIRAEFLAGKLASALDSGTLLEAAQRWLAATPQARRFFDYAVHSRSRFA